jgi:hypothetical protein
MRRLALVLALVPALALLGCSDSGSGGGAGGASSPVGTWVADLDATMPAIQKAQTAQLEKMPEEQRKMMETMIAGMMQGMRDQLGKMEFVVKGDGTWTGTMPESNGEPNAAKGTWTAKDGGWEFVVTEEGGKPVEAGSAKAKPAHLKMDGNHLRFAADADNPDLVLLLKRK